jgi:hypothetical protein
MRSIWRCGGSEGVTQRRRGAETQRRGGQIEKHPGLLKARVLCVSGDVGCLCVCQVAAVTF